MTISNEQRKEIADALLAFVLRVSSDTKEKSPEEVEALPAIASLLMSL